jgi:hypothetical protein
LGLFVRSFGLYLKITAGVVVNSAISTESLRTLVLPEGCLPSTTQRRCRRDGVRSASVRKTCPEYLSTLECRGSVRETPFSAHFRRSTRPDGRRCRGPKGRGSRCEAARAAIRFGGQVRGDVLKCTMLVAPGPGPGFGREGDASSPLLFPLHILPRSENAQEPQKLHHSRQRRQQKTGKT